ncbi:MAG: helix-turn-helix transcriptional regulator [Clostridia bacterium]|nr:helix-turn-helix transcriptional regulator [Clostridia bacterium]MBQ9995486.1 helix-turn-helix transcriptional regulator [Clostridia bacterium]
MNLGSQIKRYRNELHLSQEELAEKIFVSRQSVSNWENDKTYPDIKSLLLLSELFSVSLDTLIKGDLEIMKKEIDAQELAVFQKDSIVFSILFAVMVIAAAPLILLLEWLGIALFAILFGITMYYALRVEKHKKKYDIQTYREITAFMEGKTLDELEKARESGKRPYQKVLLVIASAVLGLIVGMIVWTVYSVFL